MGEAIIDTHKKHYVDDDENVFDEIYAAAARVTCLWFFDFDLFLRRRLFTFCSISVFALIVVVVVNTADVVVVIIISVMIVGWCAILGC